MKQLTSQDFEKLIPHIKEIAIQAGQATIELFNQGLGVEHKEDKSPVTEADRYAERIILTGLKDLNLGFPVIAEESVAAGIIPDVSKTDYFWLVDPLDGTKEFISGSGEYTINIALVHKNTPVLGVVYTPVSQELYAGYGLGTATLKKGDAQEQLIRVRPLPDIGLTVVTSRRHGDPSKIESFLKGRKIAETVARGSSLKLCQVASGLADVYPRFGPTYEWDIAAGDAVLRAAGGGTYTPLGDLMSYGKERYWTPEFVASSSNKLFV